MSGKVSVIIPSRNERFLVPTIRDIFKNATGELEVIAVLQETWPENWADAVSEFGNRLHTIFRAKAQGMRPAINDGVASAFSRGADYVCKIDAHCMVGPGFDEILKADCDDDTLIIPRRYRLDPFNWCNQDDGKIPIDYHYLSYPFEEGWETNSKIGLHGSIWNDRSKARADILVDSEMSSQGSFWFMSRKHRERLGDMDVSKYGNFINEMQELGLKTWLGGGQMLVSKRTWYSHWHKGKHGRGYWISRKEQSDGAQFATHYWMLDLWKERKRDLRWLIELFGPVPTWPEDLDYAFYHAREILTKQVAA